MENIKLIIHRYEIYGNPPMGKLVGFLIKNENTQKTEYCETIVYDDYENIRSVSETCQLAYTQLQEQLTVLINSVSGSSSVVGSEFIP